MYYMGLRALSDDEFSVVLGIVVIIIAFAMMSLFYIFSYIFAHIRYKHRINRRKRLMKDLQPSIDIPDYSPAIMSYLVNVQKIGRREICSTLVDLISRDYIKIELKSGFVSDDNAQYILTRNDKDKEIMVYEKRLIKYLFSRKKKIDNGVLHEKLYKKNLDNKFYKRFLWGIQKEAKKMNLFSEIEGERKYKRAITAMELRSYVCISIFTFIGVWINYVCDANFSKNAMIISFIVVFFGGVFMWILSFIASYMYNTLAYYNDFSPKGSIDYRKWKAFEKFLNEYSSIQNQPLMGVSIWERYYAYAISLGCAGKFYDQMKSLKIADNTIDLEIFETFNGIVKCIGLSAKKVARISIDKYGGSHTEMIAN